MNVLKVCEKLNSLHRCMRLPHTLCVWMNVFCCVQSMQCWEIISKHPCCVSDNVCEPPATGLQSGHRPQPPARHARVAGCAIAYGKANAARLVRTSRFCFNFQSMCHVLHNCVRCTTTWINLFCSPIIKYASIFLLKNKMLSDQLEEKKVQNFDLNLSTVQCQ